MSAVSKEFANSPASVERLLVVDDDRSVGEVLRIKLRREGYAVENAHSGREALERIDSVAYDLILLDIHLPDANGLELLGRLRHTWSLLETPIIVISGVDEPKEIVRALHQGANDYLTKPFDLAVVLARIRTQLSLRRLKQAHDRFLRTASHDLKKPLLLMLDVARQMREEFAPGKLTNEDHATGLNILVETGEFMQRIVEDILGLAALRDGRLPLNKNPTDLGALVRQAVVRNANYARGRGIELGMQFGAGIVPVMADDFRLMQVIENLLGNAIKFSPRGSCTTVAVRGEGGAVVCEVIDQGPGIPDEERGKLFTEYAQLRNLPTGGEKSTGLGLAISRELIALHGGSIGAHNNPTGGATFWFRLPGG